MYLHNIKYFAKAIKEGKFITCDAEGNWSIASCLGGFLRRLFGLGEAGLANAAHALGNTLLSLEEIPISFSADGSGSQLQEVNFEMYVASAKTLLEKLRTSHSKKVIAERQRLERILFGLLYRLQSANGGLDPVPADQGTVEQLSLLAAEWKFNQPVFRHKHLVNSDYSILQEACQYPNIINILLVNSDLRADFFAWALRDKISPRIFFEFPGMQSKIVESTLNGRIGCLGGGHLKIKLVGDSTGALKKILTLPFEGRDISILNDKLVVMFRGDYGLTIAEIFQVFKNKRLVAGDLEFMREGIINWNTNLWGWWDEKNQEYRKIDLALPQWWEQLPVLEVLTLKQARSRYGTHLDGRHWNVAAVATRQTPNLDYQESHAFSSIAIPTQNGQYTVFPFGKFAKEFPATLMHAFANLGKTSEATVAYPDENVFYTHRQQTQYSYALNEEQGLKYMSLIKEDMLLAIEGHFVYQIQSENCAKWSHKIIEKVLGPNRMPNLFQMPFLESEPDGFMKAVFAFVKSLPKSWQVPFTTFCHRPLGAHKGRWIYEQGKLVWKSLTHHSFWADTVIYHPSLLHKQQEIGLLGFYVAAGVTACYLSGSMLKMIAAATALVGAGLLARRSRDLGLHSAERRKLENKPPRKGNREFRGVPRASPGDAGSDAVGGAVAHECLRGISLGSYDGSHGLRGRSVLCPVL